MAKSTKKEQETEVNPLLAQIQKSITDAVAPLNQEIANLKLELSEAKKPPQAQPPAAKTPEEELKELLGQIDDEDDDRVERLSKRQLIDVMCGAFDKALAATHTKIKSDIEEGLKPHVEKMGNLEKVAYGIVAEMGVTEARQQYPDFDQYKEDIKKVLEKYPGMEFGDAYKLAKSEKVQQNQVDTEKGSRSASIPGNRLQSTRPTGNALDIMAERGRAAREEGSGSPTRSGLVGFRDMVNQALDKVVE